MAQNNKLIEKLDSIDYTHLLGYPSEVVAAEVITLVKEVVGDHMDKIVEQLEELSKYEVVEKKFEKAIEIVKGGGIDG